MRARGKIPWVADRNFNNMLICYREFTVTQARLEPDDSKRRNRSSLASLLAGKRPVYVELPADVAGVRTHPTRKPLDLSLQSSDPVQLGRAISRISKCLSQADRPAILLDADAERFGLTESITWQRGFSIPITHLVTAEGVFSDSHRWSIGIYRGASRWCGGRSRIQTARGVLLLPASAEFSVNANQGY